MPMSAVADIIPELLTVGTLASSAIGFYFERIRKRIEREEPAQIESAAEEALAGVIAEPPAPVPETGHDDKATISNEDLEKLLDSALGKGASTAIAAMKDELTAERKKDRRAAFRANIAFFIAGVMATVAITLYVHPIG
jgi:hypothetical protein